MEIQIKNATPFEILTGKFRNTYAKIHGYLQEADGDVKSRTFVNYAATGVQNRIKNIETAFESDLRKLSEECTFPLHVKTEPVPIYPPFELVQTIANACLKHSDSGEASVNKEARIVLQALEDAGYTITKKQTT